MSARDAAGVTRAYVDAVNGGDADTVVALFASDAVFHHPSGTFTGLPEIREFYETVVLAGQTVLTPGRLVHDESVAMIELAASSPLGEPGQVLHAVDVFTVDAFGLITQLDVYYR